MFRGLCVLFATVAFAASAHGDMRDLVKKSDGYEIHGMAFASAAAELIKSGLCTKSDFYEWGGFTKSTQHKKRPIYFIYCGGFQIQNRVYLNADTGKIHKK